MRKQPKPSVHTLSQIHDADHGEMRRIFLMNRAELLATDAGAARYGECHCPPDTYDLRLHCLDRAARTHGVESMESVRGEYAEYLNAGDMYASTVIYWRGRYRVQDVGTFIETMERNGVKFK